MSELSFEQMLDETFKTIRLIIKQTALLPEANIPMTRIWI